MSDRDFIRVQVHRLVHGPGVPEPLTRPYGASASSSLDGPDPYGAVDHDAGAPDVHQAGDVRALRVAPHWWGRHRR